MFFYWLKVCWLKVGHDAVAMDVVVMDLDFFILVYESLEIALW
jgi:hypothetical protein